MVGQSHPSTTTCTFINQVINHISVYLFIFISYTINPLSHSLISHHHKHIFPPLMATEPTWAQLLGQSNWSNLLNPLHPLLRSLILRCGDLIQATYDAFNNDKISPYCGSSRYGKASFFHKVMFDNPNHYDVVSFLYATARVSVPEAFLLHSLSREAWDRESNWIGYVAVSSEEQSKSIGRREIYVVWRGTTRDFEWINVFGAAPESATGLLSKKSLGELKTGNKDGKVFNYEQTRYL